MTPGSKPRSTTPNIGAGPAVASKAAMAQYPAYLPGARGPEHLSPYNNIAPSPYGRPPLMGYDSHPHVRASSMTTNGLGTIPGGKP